MVRAWMIDSSDEDQRLPHMTDPVQWVKIKDLEKIGVKYYKFDAATHEDNEEFKKLKEESGYSYQDIIRVSKDTLPNYEEKIKHFYEEHLHKDDEVRYFLDGTGYFDVRDADDKWVRVELSKDDLLVLPCGIYHRFTLDQNNYCKVMRLFIGEPVWTPFNRSTNNGLPERKAYEDKYLA